MEFAELIVVKDKAIDDDEAAQRSREDAVSALESAQAWNEKTTAALLAAHQAIHDVLAERGEHYLIDQKDGTLTVYKPSDEPPGYLAVHPIPGTKTSETKKAK